MENIYHQISLKLKGLRAENNLTYSDVGKIINVHRETARIYENNPKKMTVEIFIKLLNANLWQNAIR